MGRNAIVPVLLSSGVVAAIWIGLGIGLGTSDQPILPQVPADSHATLNRSASGEGAEGTRPDVEKALEPERSNSPTGDTTAPIAIQALDRDGNRLPDVWIVVGDETETSAHHSASGRLTIPAPQVAETLEQGVGLSVVALGWTSEHSADVVMGSRQISYRELRDASIPDAASQQVATADSASRNAVLSLPDSRDPNAGAMDPSDTAVPPSPRDFFIVLHPPGEMRIIVQDRFRSRVPGSRVEWSYPTMNTRQSVGHNNAGTNIAEQLWSALWDVVSPLGQLPETESYWPGEVQMGRDGLSHAGVRTNARGELRIITPVRGTYEVTAGYPEYASQWLKPLPEEEAVSPTDMGASAKGREAPHRSASVEIVPDEVVVKVRLMQLELRELPLFRVSGRVHMPRGTLMVAPDAPCVVHLKGEGSDSKVFVDKEGAFDIGGLTPGDYRVYARISNDTHTRGGLGRKPTDETDVLLARGNVTLGMNGEPLWLDLELQPAWELTGHLVDIHRNGIAGTELQLISDNEDLERNAYSRADGSFRFYPLYQGHYRLRTRPREEVEIHAYPDPIIVGPDCDAGPIEFRLPR